MDETEPIRISFTSSSAAIAETEKAISNNTANPHMNIFLMVPSSSKFWF
jgi:hypothetical protein